MNQVLENKRMRAVDTVTEGVAAIKAGASVAVAGGMFAWFADNGSVIGPMFAMVGGLSAFGGFCLNAYRTYRAVSIEDEENDRLDK